MQWVVGLPVIALVVALAVGLVTGRVRARSCCSVADPRRDLRMAGAFDDVSPDPRGGRTPS